MGMMFERRGKLTTAVAVAIFLLLVTVVALIATVRQSSVPRTSGTIVATTGPTAGTTTGTTAGTTASPTASPLASATATPPPPTGTGTAALFQELANQLVVDDNPDAHTGYDRDLFHAWVDADHNGCNTRAEVLILESTAQVATRSTCTVTTGSWFSSYDGVWILDASKLDIDHFVPLKEAWISGAYAWDSTTRTQFGNDLGYAASLLAVSASSNRSKSDQDPAQWMPSNANFVCDYVATWVAVKYRWSLTIDSAEKQALTSTLSNCSDVTVTVPELMLAG
jgi:hypothetical protein